MYLLQAFCLVCSLSFAQTATVNGTVADASTGEALPFCNVFINTTTLGTTSDKQGRFEIKNVPVPGSYEIVVSYVGYGSYSQKIDVSQENVILREIKLKPSEILLNDVEVKGTRDKAWEKKMKRFSSVFLGTDTQAKQCTILNPWVVDFHDNKDPNLLVATASQPIWIENKALGYKIKFILLSFSASMVDFSINGKSFFEEMKPENSQQFHKWIKERERVYRNSKQHLFKSIIEKRLSGEGFRLYMELTGSRNNRSQFFYKEELGATVLPVDTTQLVTEGPQKDVYTIRIPRRLEIHNMSEKDNSSIYRDVLYAVSWIESKNGNIVVNKNGFEMNTSAVTLGAISNSRVSRLMPTDFTPISKIVVLPETADFGFLQEKIYVHTDKPYYYPGEIIWFKGYIKYRALSLKDSLSTTVYTELIGPGNKIIDSKMLEIADGSFYNEFILPDSLASGDYYLRCYTSLNRNFGDDRLYVKYIPVLELKQTVDPANSDTTATGSELVRIVPSKDKYNTGELIGIAITSDDSTLQDAGLSVSVTDMIQVVSVHSSNTITEELDENDTSRVSMLNHPVEYGFGFNGHYEWGEGSKTEMLNVFQVKSREHLLTQSNWQGNFTVSGLHFYDSAYFAVLPMGKTKSTGATKILPREIPPVHLPATHPQVSIVQTGFPQQLHYTTDEVTILEEVTVRSTRISDTITKQIYGRPERVVSGKEIRASHSKDLFQALQALQGKFNGLWFRQFYDPGVERLRWFVYLSSNNARYRSLPSEVIITINDKRVFGLPENILSKIYIANVTSVAVYRRNHLIYGNGINSGVLSIYTNTDEWISTEMDRSKNVLVYGYKRPGVFQSTGGTIFWKPVIRLNESMSFRAGDFEGKYKIIVEGISTNGTPIRAERTITVGKDQ